MFKEIEIKVKELSPERIRLLGLKKNSIPKTLNEFIINFFKSYNNEFNTIFIKHRIVHESKGKRRSFSDIYNICKYYYPNCKVEDVMEVLVSIMGKTPGFRSSPCGKMKRRAYYYKANAAAIVYDKDFYKDELGYYYHDYENHFNKKNKN